MSEFSEIEEVVIGLLLLEGPTHIIRLTKRSGWSRGLINQTIKRLRARHVVSQVGRVVRQPHAQSLKGFTDTKLQILKWCIKAQQQNKKTTAAAIAAGIGGNKWTVASYCGFMTRLEAMHPAGTITLAPQWEQERRQQG